MSSGADHYFTREPSTPSEPRTVELTLPDLTVRLRSDRGVFSASSIDPGTRYLLLEGPRPRPSSRTLVDLGCGYGPITVALAHRSPEATVWAVDVNERARALTRANTSDLVNVRVIAPDEFPAELVVDEIWSNPPIRVGKRELHRLLQRWLSMLSPSGRAVLVVQRHLGADSLAAWLANEGHPVQRLGSRMGYRLLQVDAAARFA